MNSRMQKGFTLIEVIIFIVVVGAGLAGILAVSNTAVKSSADPMVSKQAMALADSILEEILQKEYCDPDTATLTPPAAPVCPAGRVLADQEAARADYDDVDDYNGQTMTFLVSYTVTIAVDAPADISGIPLKRVTVTASGGGHDIAMTGYRSNY